LAKKVLQNQGKRLGFGWLKNKLLHAGGHLIFGSMDFVEGKEIAEQNFWRGFQKMATANIPNLKSILAGLALASAGAGAAYEIYRHYKHNKIHREGAQKARRIFQQVVQSDPYLAQQDPQVLQEYFETLLQVAPNVAANPLLLKQTLKQALTYGGIDPQSAKLLSDLNERIVSVQMPTRPAMSPGETLFTIGRMLPGVEF
jgi:hypothetical protein